MAWGDRIREMKELGLEHHPGDVLLVRDEKELHIVINGNPDKIISKLCKAITLSDITEELYPRDCWFGLTDYKRFKAMTQEHARLCEHHARQEGWIW